MTTTINEKTLSYHHHHHHPDIGISTPLEKEDNTTPSTALHK